MIKVYLKQAWELLKQNKLFSMLYIVGTGLAIAMTMIMAVVYYAKIAPVYPEANRMNTLYLSNSKFTQGSGNNTRTMQWAVSYKALQDWFYPVENALVVSAELHNDLSENSYIQPADCSGDFPVMVKLTDPAFFKIYSFQFLEGSPFTASDLASGISTAVITDDLARRLFGTTEEVVGRSFSLNYIDYRVCGVVRSASYLTSKSYAQLYIPYTVSPDYSTPKYDLPYLGAFSATFLVQDSKQGDALRAEIKEICRKENLMHPDEWKVDFWEQPTSHLLSVFKTYASMEFDLWATVRHFLLVLLVLLLVPALNLSGMISSRMEGRLAEMGVRKSFGAGRKILLSQVMWENLLLTAPDATEQDMETAAFVSCMDEYLPQLEHGFDTVLGESGAGLSEGQAQRVSIARAVLSGAPVLLLDEATSALDAVTEQRVLERLNALPGRVCIAITHRPAALALSDRQMVIADGKITVQTL